MRELICIVCPKGCHLKIAPERGYTVTGNGCPRGAEYGKMELTNPTRVVTSTVRIDGGAHRRCPVKTDRPISKDLIPQAVAALDGVILCAPVRMGDIVVENVCGTDANFVVTRNL